MIRGLIGKALRIAAHRRQYWRTSTWPQRARLLWYAAIHAGKRHQDLDNASEWPWPDGFVPPHEVDSPTGIVGVARLVGALDVRHGRRYLQRADDADRARLDALDRDPWWAGPVGWLLDDVVAIDPVPCRGAMGLWTVPPDLAAEVVRRVEAAGMAASEPPRRRA